MGAMLIINESSMADLEKEATQSSQEPEPEDLKDFDDPDEGWLADLEIDEKIHTTQDDIPDWPKT